MEYVEEAWNSPIGVLSLLDAGEGISAARALIGLALNSPTLVPALEVTLAAARSSDPLVRGNALLSFGHLARRFGELPREPVYDLVAKGLADADAHVRGQADAAADDLDQFLGWRIDGR
ncbi:hypothetical protein [Dyella choica]|uniref:HEAT repeat domain-containing protein n=1 Tax=Dyella choica TaxID=1927959 RepID=A0A3S0WT56_9GAMM|nr:hypothetical protein [Dyella choica]RUL70512.1 hypothetical protein EKH80_20145 [Dyella choica]